MGAYERQSHREVPLHNATKLVDGVCEQGRGLMGVQNGHKEGVIKCINDRQFNKGTMLARSYTIGGLSNYFDYGNQNVP